MSKMAFLRYTNFWNIMILHFIFTVIFITGHVEAISDSDQEQPSMSNKKVILHHGTDITSDTPSVLQLLHREETSHEGITHLQNIYVRKVKFIRYPTLLYKNNEHDEFIFVQENKDTTGSYHIETNTPASLLESATSSFILKEDKFRKSLRVKRDLTDDMDEIDLHSFNSNDSHLILCDSPPNSFSPEFKGHYGESCQRGSKIKQSSFDSAMEMCQIIYSILYPDAKPFDVGYFYLADGSPLTIFDKKEFVQVCSPLLERFDVCEKIDALTVCWYSRVSFIQEGVCKRPSAQDSIFYFFLATFLLVNDTECFDKVCEGTLRVIDSEYSGVPFRLLNKVKREDTNTSCEYVHDVFPYLNNLEEHEDLFVTKNDHWPCCFSLYLVIWAGNPEDKGINGGWHYLPYSCRVAEIVIIVIMTCIAFSSVFGNLLIFLVLLRNKTRTHVTHLIRISLAVADFLKGIFIISPALCYHLKPFISATAFTQLPPDTSFMNIANESTNSFHVTNQFTITDGLIWCQGYLFTICTVASLLSLFLLSVERFLVTKEGVVLPRYFTQCRIRCLLFSFWAVGAIDAVLLSYDSEGNFNIMYRAFEKTPVAFARDYPESLFFQVIHDAQFFLLYIIGLSTLLFSVLSFWNFRKRENQVKAEWARMNMNVIGPYQEENRFIIQTLMLMAVFYLLSVVPVTVDIFLHMGDYVFQFTHLYTFASWWCFLASSAWNPWIYNMRSHHFRREAKMLLFKMLPNSLKEKYSGSSEGDRTQ